MALAAEVLREWREAERTLVLLPPESPERASVEAAVEEMRDLYQRITRVVPATARSIATARARIEETRALLGAVREGR
jgi:hypothetical protein